MTKMSFTTRSHQPRPVHIRFFKTEFDSLCAVEGFRRPEAMKIFIGATAAAMRASLFGSLGKKDLAARHDAQRDQILKPVEKDISHKMLARLADIVASAIEDEPVDFLGPVFMDLLANSDLGQFFTPTEISKTMARLVLPASPADAPLEKGYITLQEPTCGVGGMVLAANQVLKERGFDPTRQTRWHMTEIDRVAADAAYIQVSLAAVPALVNWGNILTLEVKDSWPTPRLVALAGGTVETDSGTVAA